MKPARKYLESAADSIKKANIEYTIWCIENAYCVDDGCSEEEIEAISHMIHKDDFKRAVANLKDTLSRLRRMLDYSSTLSGEEWVMILTELSTAYACVRFSERRKLEHDLYEISEIMDRIRIMTKNFTDPDIISQVKGMRRYNPNPLPPPL
jgi:hypothetical protein